MAPNHFGNLKKKKKNFKSFFLFFFIFFSITIQVTVLVNWPKERFASVPITIGVTLESLKGEALFIMPPGSDPLCTFGFTREPLSRFSLSSSVGAKTQLRNIPQVSQFIIKKMQKYLRTQLVHPNGVCFHIPVKGQRQLKVLLLTRYRSRHAALNEKPTQNGNSAVSGTNGNGATSTGTPVTN
jgi:hypothetical protein